MAKKSRPVQFTRSETELLLGLIQSAEESSEFSKQRLAAILPRLKEKAWSAYADTHPEDGPHK